MAKYQIEAEVGNIDHSGIELYDFCFFEAEFSQYPNEFELRNAVQNYWKRSWERGITCKVTNVVIKRFYQMSDW